MITTMLVDGGDLGEMEITISYRYCKPHNGKGIEPNESASATIGWIKVGGIDGVEVSPPDDFVADEIIPHCVSNWEDDSADAAAEIVRQRDIDARLAA
jgi:hypothetical protein